MVVETPRLAPPENARQVLEIEIDASIDQVWDAFTTTAGFKSWAAPLADVDFKIGGKWRANYNPQGKLGDATTIENTILSYDPRRMPVSYTHLTLPTILRV